MKTRVTRCLVALCLAVTIGAVGSALPAQAATRPQSVPAQVASLPQGVSAQVTGFDWASLVIAVASALFSGGGGSNNAALQAAIAQIQAAINQAKTEIINHTDLIAAAEVQACVDAATIEFANIDFFPPPVLILWAQNATNCATLATSYVNTVTSAQAADNIGYVIGPIFSIVLAARGRAGLVNGTDLIIQDEIRSYEAVVAKVAPQCRVYAVNLSPIVPIAEIHYDCQAYNGDAASGTELRLGPNLLGPPFDPVAIENQATRNTSRPVAQEALPKLRGVVP